MSLALRSDVAANCARFSFSICSSSRGVASEEICVDRLHIGGFGGGNLGLLSACFGCDKLLAKRQEIRCRDQFHGQRH